MPTPLCVRYKVHPWEEPFFETLEAVPLDGTAVGDERFEKALRERKSEFMRVVPEVIVWPDGCVRKYHAGPTGVPDYKERRVCQADIRELSSSVTRLDLKCKPIDANARVFVDAGYYAIEFHDDLNDFAIMSHEKNLSRKNESSDDRFRTLWVLLDGWLDARGKADCNKPITSGR